VVDAGDEEKVDGEWRMPPPKVDIVEDSSSALRDDASFGRGHSFSEVTHQLSSLGNTLTSPRALLSGI
jgi:hypothetical protein